MVDKEMLRLADVVVSIQSTDQTPLHKKERSIGRDDLVPLPLSDMRVLPVGGVESFSETFVTAPTCALEGSVVLVITLEVRTTLLVGEPLIMLVNRKTDASTITKITLETNAFASHGIFRCEICLSMSINLTS